ncbi:MAG: hypothetical protein ACKV19_22820 [Verrucomicrobiales bacterium]
MSTLERALGASRRISLAAGRDAGIVSVMPSRTRSHSRRVAGCRWTAIAAGALACYVGSYVAFSSWGQYVTSRGEEHRGAVWAPGEFYDFGHGRWRRSHTLVYAPLLWVDQWLWHRPAPQLPSS